MHNIFKQLLFKTLNLQNFRMPYKGLNKKTPLYEALVLYNFLSLNKLLRSFALRSIDIYNIASVL